MKKEGIEDCEEAKEKCNHHISLHIAHLFLPPIRKNLVEKYIEFVNIINKPCKDFLSSNIFRVYHISYMYVPICTKTR